MDAAFEFELQFSKGDPWRGPWPVAKIRELIYVGRLTGEERVRLPGTAAVMPMRDRREFAEVLALLGRESPALLRQSRVSWRSQSRDAPGFAVRQEVAPTGTFAGPMGKVPRGERAWLPIVAGGLLLALIALVVVGFVWSG